jgi:hypothetical protein
MSKYLTVSILAALLLMVSSAAWAKTTPRFTIAPSDFHAGIVDDTVVFTWSDSGFYKYTVDVCIPQDVYTANYNFSTNKNDPAVCSFDDTTDLYNCSLTVPLSAFVWDTDADPDTDPVPIYGTASAKVKALAPPFKRDHNQRNPHNQHNAFSETDYFVLVAPE